jgi:pimeloyl-ACP methyl ester carboxylesterase
MIQNREKSQDPSMTAAPAPMLLLPGLLCDDRIWAPQLAAFPDAVAVPGYGDAATLGEMAERALAIAPARFSLVGHSMGGRVALEVWRRAPERVERLALLSTGVHEVKAGEAQGRYQLLELGRREGVDALLDAWLLPMVREERHSETALMAPMRAMCGAGGVDLYGRQIGALLSRPAAEALLAGIDVPVLVATGDEDRWSSPAQHAEIAVAIPGAELVIFDHCGHMAPLEAPGQVNAALSRWLATPARHHTVHSV